MKPLTGQKKQIIDALRTGPKPNHYWPRLHPAILKYTNRMSELNALGYEIEAQRVGKTGVWMYVLVYDPECDCDEFGPMFCPVEGHISKPMEAAEAAMDEEKHHGLRGDE